MSITWRKSSLSGDLPSGERFAPCKMLRDMAEKGESFHPKSDKAA